MVEGKKILLGICGSIAAYKSILLTRLLVKAGAEVKVVMTPSAKDFVTPYLFQLFQKMKSSAKCRGMGSGIIMCNWAAGPT
jgi:phosphopantothenoylcysteine decarboxylase/phosphopantothenate--cysteine ligase